MKNIRIFLSENLPFLIVKFSIYLNRRVFVMAKHLENRQSAVARAQLAHMLNLIKGYTVR